MLEKAAKRWNCLGRRSSNRIDVLHVAVPGKHPSGLIHPVNERMAVGHGGVNGSLINLPGSLGADLAPLIDTGFRASLTWRQK